jgi:hypothetical protein
VTDSPADPRRFAGVPVPEPEFAGDDGSADPRLGRALARYLDGAASRRDVITMLLGARLMTPLVAVLDEAEHGPGGLLQEKSSHLASVSLVAQDGRRALLAFSSVGTMSAWDPAARGIPASAVRVAAAALEQGADAVLVDLAGPVRLAVEGSSLRALADGRHPPAPWDDPDVAAAVHAVAVEVPGLARVRLVAPDDLGAATAPDLCLRVQVEAGADPDAVARQLARLVVGAPHIAAECPRGVAVAVDLEDAAAVGPSGVADA